MGALEQQVESVAEVRFPGLPLGARAFSMRVVLVETTTGREHEIRYTHEVDLTDAQPRRSYNLNVPKLAPETGSGRKGKSGRKN